MTVWKQVGPWTYQFYEPDIPPNELGAFSAIVSRWQKKRQGRPVPAWSDFDFSDFKGWHGNLVIYEFSYDPFDWKVRLSGTNVDELYKRTLTGLDREEFYIDAIEREEAGEFYEMASRELLIAHTIGPLNLKDRDYREVAYLELPLSDDGKQATHSIELVLPQKSR